MEQGADGEGTLVTAIIGNRVREARTAVGLTQETLAKEIGLSRITLSRIENGHRRQVKPESLRRIAQATGKPNGYFYTIKSPDESLQDAIDRSNMSQRLALVLPRISELPTGHQDRLGGIIEDLLNWYEIGKAV